MTNRFSVTTAARKILKSKKRVRGFAGGSSAGKTISILLILIDMAQTDKQPTLTSIFAESVPILKRGVMRDFEKIMKAHNYWEETNWHKSDRTYTFESGSKIEFVNADEPEKFKGSRRDRAFLNEANNILFETYQQIEIRTKDFIYLDWNPTNEFWFYTKLKDTPEVDFQILTYKDNEALDKNIVKALESKKNNTQWWRVYGLGLLGEVEGRVFKGWQFIDGIPHEARLITRGLDFGYTNDPTAMVDIYEYNGGFIFDEIIYQKGLSNRQIADIILAQEEQVIVIADSAEPKSIDEIKSYGINIEATVKGAGSINTGVAWVQDQKISVTRASKNISVEYNNWMWKKDRKLDTYINTTEDAFNHSMDAIRYGLSLKIFREDSGVIEYSNDMFEEQEYNY